MRTSQTKWMQNFERLKSHVEETGHFPNKHTQLNNWCRYQRKRIKNGSMPKEQMRLFKSLAESRSNAHTGGKEETKTFSEFY